MLLLWVAYSGPLSSQGDLSFSIRGWNSGDSILLRWYPTDLESWNHMLKHGYKLTRETIITESKATNNQIVRSDLIVLADTINVWSETKWKSALDTLDEWEMVAAGMVYGDFAEETEGVLFNPESIEDRTMMEENRFAIALHASNHSMQAAKRLGLSFVDHSIGNSHTYLYTLIPHAGREEDVVAILVDAKTTKNLPPPSISQIVWGDQQATLGWNHYPLEDYFVSYEVERSAPGVSSWEKRNMAPVIPSIDLEEAILTTFLDRLSDNEQYYYYRVRGHSPFGFNGPWSEPISGKGQPSVPAMFIDLESLQELMNGDIIIKWKTNQTSENIAEINLYRGLDYNGPFTKINQKNLVDTENVFKDQVEDNTLFYYAEIKDTTGNEKVSLIKMINRKDVNPPAIPSEPNCRLDTIQGGIYLDWKSNEEKDLEGYRIFSSFRENDGYQDISPNLVKESKYFWSLPINQNGEPVFLRIEAVDNRFNRSLPSASCKVNLLDTKSPAGPLIRKVLDNKDKVIFEWAGSPSYDVASHSIWRSDDGVSWNLKQEMNKNPTIQYFIDSVDLVRNQTYHYKIVATDHGGNTTSSPIHKVKVWKDRLAPAIQNFEISKNSQTGSTLLSWQYLAPSYCESIEIYRQEIDGKAVLYQNITDPQNIIYSSINDRSGLFQWIDPQHTQKENHRYAIRIILKNGDVSPRTEWQKPITR